MASHRLGDGLQLQCPLIATHSPQCSNPTELLVPTHSNCCESLSGPFCPEQAGPGLGTNMKVRADSLGRSLTCHGTTVTCGQMRLLRHTPPPPRICLHFPRSLPASEGTRASQRPVSSLWRKVPARRMLSLFRSPVPFPPLQLPSESAKWGVESPV